MSINLKWLSWSFLIIISDKLLTIILENSIHYYLVILYTSFYIATSYPFKFSIARSRFSL
jgi:hypothetical protein